MQGSPDSHTHLAWHRKHRKLLLTLALIVLVLLVLRLFLAQILQWYVNTKLDESPEYDGQIGAIDLRILRGAYRIDGVELFKTTGAVPVPLFSASAVEFSILWGALFDGAVVGEVELFDPVINIVDSEDEATQQTGEEGQWISVAEDLFPLRIDRIAVHQGKLHFRNFDSEPQVDIFVSQIEGEVQNLTNSTDVADTMVARIDFTALAMDTSELVIEMAFDPSLRNPTFNLDARMLQLPLMHLDSFIDAYAPFDIEAGSIDVVTELAASEGRLQGYVKPIIYNLDVFEWRADVEEDGDNPFRVAWEALVGFVGELLQNQPRDQLATNIPIDGDISSPETSTLAVVMNILRNAFVEAFQANFENTISWGSDDEDAAAAEVPAESGSAGRDGE